MKAAAILLLNEFAAGHCTTGTVSLDQGRINISFDKDEQCIRFAGDFSVAEFKTAHQAVSDKLATMGYVISDVSFINGTSFKNCEAVSIRFKEHDTQ
ncbi:hypothetical protein [Bacteroides sp.]|uniref:hypothetical protein n=1 Tax=Bacteroides sp. TaxID=29523 RepID=UPI00263367D6|nr:hypothetical protein [Bacteroides sp.]MDD3039547.1 hypothetical protein [Bacteroides sp.]